MSKETKLVILYCCLAVLLIILIITFGFKDDSKEYRDNYDSSISSEVDLLDTESTEPSTEVEANTEGLDETTEEAVNLEDNGTLDNLKFTVDITDNLTEQESLIIGNTSTTTSYSGIIKIVIPEELKDIASEIKVGGTYIITTQPMITMSIPPQTTMVKFNEASDADIAELEAIRLKVSNYSDRMQAYENMSLDEIITDSNLNYASWMQEEIEEFKNFLSEKGYKPEDNSNKSFANLRDQLNGSIISAELE